MKEKRDALPMEDRSGSTLVGFALFFLSLTGLAGLVAAGFSVFQPDFVGMGVCLASSALSFGLMLSALLRG